MLADFILVEHASWNTLYKYRSQFIYNNNYCYLDCSTKFHLCSAQELLDPSDRKLWRNVVFCRIDAYIKKKLKQTTHVIWLWPKCGVTHDIKVCWMLGGMNHWGKGRKLNDVVYKKTNRGGQVPFSPLRSLGMGKQVCRLSDLYLEHKQAWRTYAAAIDEMFGTELPHRSVVC